MCGFSVDRLKRLSQLERWHFWFVFRQLIVTRLLCRFLRDKSRMVLDLGCGTGAMLDVLARMGHAMVGLDALTDGLRSALLTRPGSLVVRASATHLPFKGKVFGAVMLLDVLEHVDDGKALIEVHRVLARDGLVIMTVPAMPGVWSYRDMAAGHLRRYTSSQLRSMLTKASLLVEEMHYYQSLLFPLIVFTRLLGRRGPALRDLEERPFPFLNALMGWVCRAELQLSDRIRLPWGSSLVAVCRKR